MGQYRPNHTGIISDSSHCTSICGGSRVTQSIHVSTLEKFVSFAGPRHDVWLAHQLRFYILAYPCPHFCTPPLSSLGYTDSRLMRCVLGRVLLLRIQFLRHRWWERESLPNEFRDIYEIYCLQNREVMMEWRFRSYILHCTSFWTIILPDRQSKIGF